MKHITLSTIQEKIISNIIIFLGIFLCSFYISLTFKQLENTYYIAILVPTCCCIFAWKLSYLKKEPLFYLTLLYFLYATVSVLWSEHPTISACVKIFRYSLYLIIFYICIHLTIQYNYNKINKLLFIVVIMASISALLSILYFYLYQNHPIQNRLEGFFCSQNANMANLIYCPCLLLCIHSLMRCSKNRLIYICSGIILLSYLLLTQNRAAIGIFFIILFFFIIYSSYKNWKHCLLLLFGYAILLIIAIFTIYSWRYNSIDIEMNTIETQIQEQLLKNNKNLPEEELQLKLQQSHLSRVMPFRPMIWKHFWEKFLERPILGHGYNTNMNITLNYFNYSRFAHHSHSMYLANLYYGGIIGFVLIAISILFVLYKIYKMRRYMLIEKMALIFLFVISFLLVDGESILKRPREIWFGFWFPYFMIIILSHSPLLLSDTPKEEH